MPIRIATSFIVLLTFAWSNGAAPPASTSQPADMEFKTDGEMIHPRIIQELSPWLSDGGEMVLSIDVSNAQHSDRYHGDFTSTKDSASIRIDDTTFSYSSVGKCAPDVFVLITSENGGGSGWFTHLLVTRLSTRDSKNLRGEVRTQRILELIGEEGLRDRFNGSITVDGATIRIGAHTTPAGHAVAGRVLEVPLRVPPVAR